MTQRLLIFPAIGDYLVIKEPISANGQGLGEIKVVDITNGSNSKVSLSLEKYDLFRIKNISINRHVRDIYDSTAVLALRLPHRDIITSRLNNKNLKITSRTIYFSSNDLDSKCFIFKSLEEASSYISSETNKHQSNIMKRFSMLDE